MALKRKINKAEFDKLSADIKAEYVADGDDYVLDVDGDVDASSLQRAKDRAVQDRKDALKELADAKAKLADIDGNDARKSGDIAKLDAAHKDKIAAMEKDAAEKLAAKDAFISTSLVDNVATQMAAKLSKSPALLLPHIKARLSADLTGDTPKTVYMDKEGNPTTAEALTKEFVDNPDFKDVMLASKSTGGGAPDQSKGRALRPKTEDGKDVSLASLSGKDLAAQISAKKEAAESGAE